MDQQTYSSREFTAQPLFPANWDFSGRCQYDLELSSTCICCKEAELTVRWLHLMDPLNRVAIKSESLASARWTEAGLRSHVYDFHVDRSDSVARKYSVLSEGVLRSYMSLWMYRESMRTFDNFGMDIIRSGPGNREEQARVWRLRFCLVYPSFIPYRDLLDPFTYNDVDLTGDTLKLIYESRVGLTLMSANLISGIGDPSLRYGGGSRFYYPFSFLYRSRKLQRKQKSEPEEELRYYSTETQPAGQPLLIGPRDSVEPRYQTRDGYSDEVKHVDRMRLTDEIHYPTQQRGTDELMESAPIRCASDELVVKSSPRMESRVYEVPAHQQSPGIRPRVRHPERYYQYGNLKGDTWE